VETVLKMIVSGLVDTAGVALARIWLLGPGDVCSTCRMSAECADRRTCLHLAASAGRSCAGGADWSGLNGGFRRFPLHVRKIGWIASTGEPMLIEHSVSDTKWTLHPDWVRTEGIHGFAGHPLVFGCNGPRYLPVTESDSRLGFLTVFPSSPIVLNGPRRQGFASPRNYGAPLTAPGRSLARSERRERPRLVADHNVTRSGAKIVEDYIRGRSAGSAWGLCENAHRSTAVQVASRFCRSGFGFHR